MLSPAKTKFRKQQKGRIKGKESRCNTLHFGDYGLQALESGWIKQNQIEAGRVSVSKCIKQAGKMWIRIFPDKPVSKKPAETRMGKGKGDPTFWVAVVKAGRILYELQGVTRDDAIKALQNAGHKMPVKTRIVVRG